MFTAIVLSDASRASCIARALGLGVIIPRDIVKHSIKCHHVTLAMGDASDRFTIGEERHLTVTHVGTIAGRVVAFKVEGASDSKNKVPHVTIATFGDAKPKESNDITEWKEIASFPLVGMVSVCR